MKNDERALNPNLKFGRYILGEASKTWGDYLLVTMPEAWKSAEKMIPKRPTAIHHVTTMDRATIERQVESLPGSDAIVGLGGGMALDFAKFVAWKRGVDPVLVPSAASVDAGVCTSIAVREQNKVRYIGYAVAREIICDFALMRTAPVNINRAGIGDILSIHTALHDWRLATEKGKADFMEEYALATAQLVDELEDMAGEIGQASEKGLRWLMEAYARENAVCIRNGNSRPEEGSEHFFAYNMERLTGRSFVHGELVCLGVLLLARLQENRPERVKKILAKTGVRFQPAELGISRAELEKSLITLKEFAEKEGLAFSVINCKEINATAVKHMIKNLQI